MSSGKADNFVMEDSFLDEESAGEFDHDELNKVSSIRSSHTKRRIIDDRLEERRLQRNLRDYDFDLDE